VRTQIHSLTYLLLFYDRRAR